MLSKLELPKLKNFYYFAKQVYSQPAAYMKGAAVSFIEGTLTVAAKIAIHTARFAFDALCDAGKAALNLVYTPQAKKAEEVAKEDFVAINIGDIKDDNAKSANNSSWQKAKTFVVDTWNEGGEFAEAREELSANHLLSKLLLGALSYTQHVVTTVASGIIEVPLKSVADGVSSAYEAGYNEANIDNLTAVEDGNFVKISSIKASEVGLTGEPGVESVFAACSQSSLHN